MSAEEANEAIAKAEHVVDVLERAIAGGLGDEPSVMNAEHGSFMEASAADTG